MERKPQQVNPPHSLIMHINNVPSRNDQARSAEWLFVAQRTCVNTLFGKAELIYVLHIFPKIFKLILPLFYDSDYQFRHGREAQ